MKLGLFVDGKSNWSVLSYDEIQKLLAHPLLNARWSDAHGEIKIISHIIVPYMAYSKAERA